MEIACPKSLEVPSLLQGNGLAVRTLGEHPRACFELGWGVCRGADIQLGRVVISPDLEGHGSLRASGQGRVGLGSGRRSTGADGFVFDGSLVLDGSFGGQGLMRLNWWYFKSMCLVFALKTPISISFRSHWLLQPTHTGFSEETSGRAFRTCRSQIVASEAAVGDCGVETATTDWDLACRDFGSPFMGMLPPADFRVDVHPAQFSRRKVYSAFIAFFYWLPLGRLRQLLGSKDLHVHRLLTLLLEKQNFLFLLIGGVHHCAVLRLAHL